MKLAFITDLHFGRQTPGAADALLADLRAQQPDLILIGGDVTQRGLAYQYRACQAYLKQLPAPWLCVIGNHDVPAWNLIERFCAPYHAYQKFITRDLNPTYVNDRVAVQGLNSARRWLRDGAWEQGEISNWQIDLTARFFSQHPEKTKIVMVHHPLTHPPDRPAKLLVHRHETALRGFAAAGADMILTGHLHRASVQRIPSPSRERVDGELASQTGEGLWMVHGGTALCDRLRGESNNYWMLDISAQPQFTLRPIVPT